MTSGPYQSQVFNFLTQHYRRLRDHLQHSLRRGTVNAIWVLQVALYPFYVLTQATRTAGRQLGQTLRRSLPQSRAVAPPSCDQPIEAVLRSLPALGLAVVEDVPPIPSPLFTDPSPAPNPKRWLSWLPGWRRSPVPPSPSAIVLLPPAPLQLLGSAQELPRPIQGIACERESRALQLVAVGNRLLAQLSPSQQQQLQQRICLELASYSHAQRLWAPANYLPLPSTSDRLLPPVRWFNLALRWMQTSPIAVGMNLFYEGRMEGAIAVVPVYSPASSGASSGQDLAAAYELWENGQRYASIDAQLLAAMADGLKKNPWVGDRSSDNPSDDLPPAPMQVAQTTAAQSTQPPDARESSQRSDAIAPVGDAVKGDRLDAGDPDWVEADALLVGYVRHPLEQLLNWLDRGMVWLEERTLSFLGWVKQRLSR